MTDSATIFALATPPGRGGVSVFRVSGREVTRAIESLCKPTTLPNPREAVLRKIHHPETGEKIDHALILRFVAPESFTGEDVLEFHTHGGRAVANAMTDAFRSLGFRLAEPGEFTRRAFENGKMDLTEAEAIADLVHAETDAQRRQALRQMEGELGKIYEAWRSRLIRSLAYLEAAIDFSDEELPADLAEKQVGDLKILADEIAHHLNDHRRGEILRDGFSIAILGAPNAGKSSLLNALARRDAAIVSSTAGTTRDIIEVHLDLGGWPVVLADTAGLRDTDAEIESEGIRRARQRATHADLKLLVFDGTAQAPDATTLALIDVRAIVVVNKADAVGDRDSGFRFQEKISSYCTESQIPNPASPLPPISAQTGEGILALLERLTHEIDMRFADAGPPPLTRARHRTALEETQNHLQRALTAVEGELRAEDVRLAMRSLGRITGRVGVEDLLDVIFRDFCIGK
jgi:tRNA modification GTPase